MTLGLDERMSPKLLYQVGEWEISRPAQPQDTQALPENVFDFLLASDILTFDASNLAPAVGRF